MKWCNGRFTVTGTYDVGLFADSASLYPTSYMKVVSDFVFTQLCTGKFFGFLARSSDKGNEDTAGEIKPGQVSAMYANMDAGTGTLEFWLDGNPHCAGYTSGKI